ncbi:MAG TPA: peptidylprolyl isomerase, partial [bacterium]
MKRFFVSGLVLILMLSGCGKSPKLKKDTPAYRFAKEVAAKLPYLDPDKNNVLVSSKKFKITTGEALNEIFLSSGKRSSQFLAMNPEQIKFYVEQTAMNLGEKRILMDQVKKMNIDVTPVQVDSVVNDYVNQVGGQEKFNKSLNDMGITLNLIKRDFHDQLAIDRVFTHRFAEDIRVTEQEIQQAHEQGSVATVRHILLLTQGKGDSTRKEQYRKMLAIQQRIRRGEDFAVLANRYSEDPGSNQKGGMVENFKRGDMVPAFDEAA